MYDITSHLIVALDMNTPEEVDKVVTELYPLVKMFKIGPAFPISYLSETIKLIGERGGKVFLDYKYNDIPHTVYSAVASSTASSVSVVYITTAETYDSNAPLISPLVFMMSVYTEGGQEMLKAAAQAAKDKAAELKIEKPYIVGVTVLTSQINTENTLDLVLERARIAKESGLDGVVCSANEAKFIRQKFGGDFIIVTPGIRAKNAPPDDQKRVATAKEAIEAGANYIVVGRPIVKAKDKKQAVCELLG